ncbi:zinc-dependent alcohol dehydrogenase family protein [soil metagenome]
MRLCFHQCGRPQEVLSLEPYEAPEPHRHEVVVQMLYAPINPADLNFIEGTYGKLPHHPAVPGNEGCGKVIGIGEEVTSLAVGDLVIPLYPLGVWSQHLVAAENKFAKLPTDLDPVQASMLRVNPTTAWQLLQEFRDLQPGDIIAQNAANSGVGQAIIQIARHLDIKTINFVRRKELFTELTALGADLVFLDDAEGHAEAKKFVDSQKLTLALNAVGGDSALRLMDLLSPDGALVTYGAMSRRSLKVPNKHLIFKNLEIRGYWLSKWAETASHLEMQEVLRPLATMMLKGQLKLPVDQIVPMTHYREAISLAQGQGRNGKIIIKF